MLTFEQIKTGLDKHRLIDLLDMEILKEIYRNKEQSKYCTIIKGVICANSK